MKRSETIVAAWVLSLLAKHIVPAIEAWGDELRRVVEGEVPERPQPEPLLRTAEAARYLSISTSLLQDLVSRKLIPTVRLGRETTRFDRTVLQAWARGGGLQQIPPKLLERDAKRVAERTSA